LVSSSVPPVCLKKSPSSAVSAYHEIWLELWPPYVKDVSAIGHKSGDPSSLSIAIAGIASIPTRAKNANFFDLEISECVAFKFDIRKFFIVFSYC
jgi:hypothetical protein